VTDFRLNNLYSRENQHFLDTDINAGI